MAHSMLVKVIIAAVGIKGVKPNQQSPHPIEIPQIMQAATTTLTNKENFLMLFMSGFSAVIALHSL